MTAMCGTDATGNAYTPELCLVKSWNVSCLTDFASTTVDVDVELGVGSVSAINPNRDKFGPYTGLELPTFNAIDVQAPSQTMRPRLLSPSLLLPKL